MTATRFKAVCPCVPLEWVSLAIGDGRSYVTANGDGERGQDSAGTDTDGGSAAQVESVKAEEVVAAAGAAGSAGSTEMQKTVRACLLMYPCMSNLAW